MKHFDIDTLQWYLDGEVSAREKSLVEAHLGTCSTCSEKLAQLQGRAYRIRELLNTLPEAEEALPPLPAGLDGQLQMAVQEHPDAVGTRRPVWKRMAACLAAACLLGGIFLYKPLLCRANNQEMMRMQREIVEVDANTPYEDQETVLTVMDSEGQVTYLE